MVHKDNTNTQDWVVFLQVHPFNWLLAWVLSFFTPVAYWKKSGVAEGYCQRFLRLHPADVYRNGQAEWNTMTADAYDAFAEVAPKDWSSLKITGQFDGMSIDFTSTAMSEISEDYEAHYQINSLINKWRNSRPDVAAVTLVDTRFRQDAKRLGLSIPEQGVKIDFSIASWLDRLRDRTEQTLMIARTIRQAWRCQAEETALKQFSIFAKGISVNELAEGEDKFDFSFLVQRGLLKPEEILYLVPIPLSCATAAWCSE